MPPPLVGRATRLASCTLTPSEAAGAYNIVASFGDTSDPQYATSSTTNGFTVTLEQSTTTYIGPKVILQGSSGVTLSGQLLEDGVTPIVGRTLTLGLGAQSCTGVTDASGVANCTLVFVGPLGSEPLSASFVSDGYYMSSSLVGTTPWALNYEDGFDSNNQTSGYVRCVR